MSAPLIQIEPKAVISLTGAELEQAYLCAQDESSPSLRKIWERLERALGVEPVSAWGEGYSAARQKQLGVVRKFFKENSRRELHLELTRSQLRAIERPLKSPPLSAAIDHALCEKLLQKLKLTKLREPGVYDLDEDQAADVFSAIDSMRAG